MEYKWDPEASAGPGTGNNPTYRRDSTYVPDDKLPTADLPAHTKGRQFSVDNEPLVTADVNKLKRNLHGRHMQMIAIGIVLSFSWSPLHASLTLLPLL